MQPLKGRSRGVETAHGSNSRSSSLGILYRGAKKRSKKKPIVIVSGSESDSDSDNVVYIRRRARKPVPQAKAPVAPQTVYNPFFNPLYAVGMSSFM